MVAESQNGYTGSSDSSNRSGVVTGSAGNYTEYNLWYHYPNTTNHDSYCNLFVSWCLHAAGVSESIAPKNPFYISHPRYNDWVDCGAEIYSWKDYTDGLYTPMQGDILLYETSSSSDVSGASLSGTHSEHVGIITGYDTNAKKITTIEGATSRYKVAIKSRTPRETDGYAGYQNGNGKNRYYYAFIRPAYNQGGSPSQPTDPYLTISGETYPTGTLPLNKGFSLKGFISSYPKLTNVTAQIINTSTGQVVPGFDYSVNPNSTTYNIQNDGIDSAFKFANLQAGSYRYLVTAENESVSKILISSYFSMGNSAVESTLSINPASTSYTIVQGNSCSVTGSIDSNYNITRVTATLDGNQYVNLTPNKKTVDIGATGSGQINSFKGRELSVGTHYIVITATDASPKTVTTTITITVTPSETNNYYLEFNFYLDGWYTPDFAQYGYVDLYINGNYYCQISGDWWQQFPYGTQYEFRTAYTAPGYSYVGVRTGTISGTIGASDVKVQLNYSTNSYYLDLNAVLDNDQKWDTNGFGYAELYINGELAVKGDASYFDYCKALPYGTTYEIRNIRPLEGYSFDGFYTGTDFSFKEFANGSRTGTITKDTSVALVFHTCPSGIDENPEPVIYNGHTYYYFSTPVTWYDAKSICEGMGGHLATITSEAEDSFLLNHVKSFNNSDFGVGAWLGGTDRDSEGTWTWITGEAFDFTKWASSEPSNSVWNDEGAENFLHYYNVAQGQWNDTAGCDRFPFICEVDTAGYLNINGLLDNNEAGSIRNYGTADVYINGELVESSGVEYFSALPYGTTYEIRNIRPRDGRSYDGISEIAVDGYSAGSRSGTITGYTNVRLAFHTSPTSIAENPEPVTHNGHTYYYFSTPVTWYDAKSICEGMGGHLATITSEAEDSFLLNHVKSFNNSDFGVGAWLGGTDRDSEGTWTWITGEAFDFTKWASSEPSNSVWNDEGAENFLHYYNVAQGQWNDTAGCDRFPFICEVDTAEYTITYDANGGTGAPEPQRKTHAVALQLSAVSPTREGYTFLGWAEEADAAEAQYQPGEEFTKDADIVLYAVWEIDDYIIASGECGAQGDNLTWTLSNRGDLVITGTGDMANYRSGTAPWYEHRADIKSVSIEAGATSIGDCAFYQCKNVNSVVIPEGVTKLGKQAFYYCDGIVDLELPDSVSEIGASAFQNCGALTNVTIPMGVTSLQKQVFQSCTSLKTVTIPEGLTSISETAFCDCKSLTAFIVDEGNSAYSSLDGVLVSKDETVIVRCPPAKTGAFCVPAGTTAIPGYAFQGCSGLTSIELPDTVTSIGKTAFHGCSGLTAFTIPDGVDTIEDSTFYYCSSIKEISIPNSVSSIGEYAFSGCNSLTDVYYGGPESQWAEIIVRTHNEPLDSATIHFTEQPTHIPGDVNGDGSVTTKDFVVLMKYLAGEDVYVVENALDVNGDGKVSTKDFVTLMKYLAGEDVTIY